VKPNEIAEKCREYHDALLPGLRYAARRCGYALAVHGSLTRDIDVIAAPWRDTAPDAAYLIEMLKKVIEAVCGTARHREGNEQPTKMPCGRLAWSIYLTHRDEPPYLDISVMPKGEHPKEPRAKTKKRRK